MSACIPGLVVNVCIFATSVVVNTNSSWSRTVPPSVPKSALRIHPSELRAGKPVTSPEDASRHTPSAPAPPTTAYIAVSSTAAHAPASPGSPANPPPPPACASQTHDAGYAGGHLPAGHGSAQSPSQSAPHFASSTGSPRAFASSSSTVHSQPKSLYPPPAVSPAAKADKPSTPTPPHPPAEPAVPSAPCPAPAPHRPATSRSPYPAPPAPSSESRTHTTTQKSPCPAPARPPHPASLSPPHPRPGCSPSHSLPA